MKRLSIILMALMLAACGGKEAAQQPGHLAPNSVKVDKTNHILVLPFTCNILPAENAATAAMLQNQLSARIVYMLQSAGIASEQYILDVSNQYPGQSASYASLLPASYGPGGGALPAPGKMDEAQMAATSFIEVSDWDTQLVPVRDVREFGTAAAPTPVGDTDYEPLKAADAQPSFYGQRERIMEEAKARGYDYVLAGTIALVRTEVSPTIKIAGTERASIRSELNVAFQLLNVNNGSIGKSGAARGRDAKMIVVKESGLNSYHLYSALDKVMHQANFYTAKRIAEYLAERSLDDILSRDEINDEASYYQDSPGKRLRD